MGFDPMRGCLPAHPPKVEVAKKSAGVYSLGLKVRYTTMRLLNLPAIAASDPRTSVRLRVPARASRSVLPSTSRPNLFSGD